MTCRKGRVGGLHLSPHASCLSAHPAAWPFPPSLGIVPLSVDGGSVSWWVSLHKFLTSVGYFCDSGLTSSGFCRPPSVLPPSETLTGTDQWVPGGPWGLSDSVSWQMCCWWSASAVRTAPCYQAPGGQLIPGIRCHAPGQACPPRRPTSSFHCCLWKAASPKGCAVCPVGTQVCTEVPFSEEQVVSQPCLGSCVCVVLFCTVNNGCPPPHPIGLSCLWAHTLRPGSQRGRPELACSERHPG